MAQVGGGRSQLRAPGDQFAHGQPEQVLNQERTESRPAGVTGGGPGQGAPAAKPFVRPQGLVESATPETVELLGPEMGRDRFVHDGKQLDGQRSERVDQRSDLPGIICRLKQREAGDHSFARPVSCQWGCPTVGELAACGLRVQPSAEFLGDLRTQLDLPQSGQQRGDLSGARDRQLLHQPPGCFDSPHPFDRLQAQ